ncbi:MAG: BMC domain-containing protein [Clostridiales bacterium]|jgi:microcompartment protein CcmL/EutN|nr:BMC domain-containing protein [Clostridiales bacterium]
MSNTIGFLELNSVARGIYAADAMLKAADVKLLRASANCPGKYNILISGEVAAVNAAVEVGAQIGGPNVIEQLVIPRLHPQVIHAMGGTTMPDKLDAVGVLECFSITSSILAADSAVKATDVTLIDVRLGTGLGGKSFLVMTGDTAAVSEAVERAAAVVAKSGMLLETAIIPNPRKEIFEALL